MTENNKNTPEQDVKILPEEELENIAAGVGQPLNRVEVDLEEHLKDLQGTPLRDKK